MNEHIATAADLHGRLADADLPEDYKLAAYPVLLARALGGAPSPQTGGVDQPAPADTAAVGTSGPSPSPSDNAALGRRTGREVSQLEDIYDLSTDPPSLIVSVRKLDTAVAKATAQIALLVVAARQGGGTEDWTKASEIRAVCQDYSRFDSSNFAGTLTAMHEEFAFRGRGQAREVRLTRPGWDALSEVLTELGA